MTRRVLMLSWEYPPHHVGGLGRHVGHLSRYLLERGAEVTVVTRAAGGMPQEWDDGGTKVLATVPYDLHPPDFVTWAAQFNVSVMETAVRRLDPDDFDLIHVHDWIVAYSGRALKHAWGLPLVATIHATEFGRQGGLYNQSQAHISETEWWLCYEACRVITCSRCMKAEVEGVFGVPGDKIRVIPNGIDDSWFRVPRKPSGCPLVIFVGRLVPEKGAQTLVDAMEDVVREVPDAELIIAGAGPMEADIISRIHRARLLDRARMVGRLDDAGLRDLYSRAWVACFPSSYEPFGIVALEAMATGVPCVVGDVGGLREIVAHRRTGLAVQAGNPKALARAITDQIKDRTRAEEMARRARRVAFSDYSWSDVAGKTAAVYDEVLGTGEFFWADPETVEEKVRRETGGDPEALAARQDFAR